MNPIPWSQLSREEKRLRLARSWRLAAPTLATIISLLFMLIPIWLQGPLLPQLGLLGVCYWVITRPQLMPPAAAFLIGLIQDLWLGTPLGINALLLMITALILSGQYLVFASRPFSFAWLVMLPVTLIHALVGWVLSELCGRSIAPGPLLLQAILTALSFPLATWAHARVQRRIVDPYLQEAV